MAKIMIGSFGTLGVITQAWMRLQDRPKFRDGGAVRFKDFFSAARAVRSPTEMFCASIASRSASARGSGLSRPVRWPSRFW